MRQPGSSGSSEVVANFDGACQPPRGGGVSAYGFVLHGAGIDAEGRGPAVALGDPNSTNNAAEYVAAIRALEKLEALGFRGPVVLRGDSQLVIRQMEGTYTVHSDRLREHHHRLRELCRTFRSVRFEWVPREQNRRADELSKQALRERAART